LPSCFREGLVRVEAMEQKSEFLNAFFLADFVSLVADENEAASP